MQGPRALILLLIGGLLTAGCVRAGFDARLHARTDIGSGATGDGPTRDGARNDGTSSAAESGATGDARRNPDRAPLSDGGGQPATVNAANDTCANPAVVDLAPLASGKSVTVRLSTRGAKADYGWSACGGLPDVVVRLINNSVPKVVLSCAGTGQVAGVTQSMTNMACTNWTVTSALVLSSCGPGVTSGHNLPAGTSYVGLCRDAAAAPVDVTFAP